MMGLFGSSSGNDNVHEHDYETVDEWWTYSEDRGGRHISATDDYLLVTVQGMSRIECTTCGETREQPRREKTILKKPIEDIQNADTFQGTLDKDFDTIVPTEGDVDVR